MNLFLFIHEWTQTSSLTFNLKKIWELCSWEKKFACFTVRLRKSDNINPHLNYPYRVRSTQPPYTSFLNSLKQITSLTFKIKCQHGQPKATRIVEVHSIFKQPSARFLPPVDGVLLTNLGEDPPPVRLCLSYIDTWPAATRVLFEEERGPFERGCVLMWRH